MRPRPSTVLALGLAALTLLQGVATVVLVSMPPLPGVPASNVSLAQILLDGAFLFITPVVGALVAVRRPENPTGWLFLATVALLGLSFFSDEFTRHVAPSLALGYLATFGGSFPNLAFSTLFILFALFPTGHLPGPRWRLLWVPIAVGAASLLFSGMFQPGPQQSPAIPDLPQPLAQPGWRQILDVTSAIGGAGMVASLAGTAGLLVYRFRQAEGVERQQLKWFVSAASAFGVLLIGAVIVQVVDQPAADVAWTAAICSLPLLPVAAAIAILRYRLFDIDLLINRTLVYAGLSAVLLAVYGASVLLLQQVLSPLTATSSLAVAVSTLLVAALFQPVRRRVQSAVDRRFYRQRYSAGREIARFGASLRDEVDIERVQALLGAVVDRTVQPAFASVWLREGDGE